MQQEQAPFPGSGSGLGPGPGSETAHVVRANQVPPVDDSRLLKMASLLGLFRASSRANSRALALLMANETAQAVPYAVCAIWDGGRRTVAAVSGSETVEKGAPLVVWTGRAMKHLARQSRRQLSDASEQETAGSAIVLDIDTVTGLGDEMDGEWRQVLPLHTHALWMPMQDPRSLGKRPRIVGGMLMLRDVPFTEWDIEAASLLAGSYAQSMILAGIPLVFARKPRLGIGIPLALLVGALISAGLLIQTREGVLCPAEVVAEIPLYVRAPQPGIVATLLVKPGEQVVAGQELARLDAAELTAKEAASRGALSAADAELRQANQEAVFDAKSRSRLPGLRAKVEEAQADMALARLRLDRTHLLSPVTGSVVFDDAAELTGKPVEAGERLLLVSPASSLRIEAKLPSSDDLPALVVGGQMRFHPNGSPLDSRLAAVDYVSYSAATAQDGTTSRIVRGEATGEPLRLGTRGTARVYGGERPILLWALRRPITSVRQWLGL